MGKLVDNTVLDAALNILKTTAIRELVSSGTPASYADAVANALATHVTASADFTISDGTSSGRMVTVASASGITVDNSGTALHLCLTDGSATLLYQTTITSQALGAGNTCDVPAWTATIGDPA